MAETHELEIRFVDADGGRAASAKRRVLARLGELGITEFAEGVIDGVDVLLDESQLPNFDDDRTPILVFDRDAGKLALLEAELNRLLGEAVGFRRAVLADESWSQAWDEGDALIRTRRFVVWPEGRAGAPPAGPTVIRLVRGEAFGSGRHATTQVALEVLEDLDLARGPALDVGTGTGILLVAAHHLGFGPLVGTEIDDVVLAEARRNAALNQVAMRLENRAEPKRDQRYALIIANILVPVLHHLLPVLKDLLLPEGRIVLAGFIDKEAKPLGEAAARIGLFEESRKVCRGWVGLVLRPH